MSGQDAFTQEAMEFLSLTSLYVPFDFASQPTMTCFLPIMQPPHPGVLFGRRTHLCPPVYHVIVAT